VVDSLRPRLAIRKMIREETSADHHLGLQSSPYGGRA